MVIWLVILVAVVVSAALIGSRLGRRGAPQRARGQSLRRRFGTWSILAAGVGLTLFAGWAIADGHPVLGIAVLAAVYVLPLPFLLAWRIRKS